MSNNNNKKNQFKPQDAIAYAKVLISNSTSVPTNAQDGTLITAIAEKLQLELSPSQFPPQAITAMAQSIYAQARAQLDFEASTQSALDAVSPADMDRVSSLIADNSASLWAAIQANPDGQVFALGTDPIVDLLIAITAHALVNFHPSQWIRYDKKEIFVIANLTKLPASAQEELMQDIHTLWNLTMRVIGSNQPIPCYNAPWLVPIQVADTDLLTIFHNLGVLHVANAIRAHIQQLQQDANTITEAINIKNKLSIKE